MNWTNYIGSDYLVDPEVCKEIIELGESKFDNGFGMKEPIFEKDRSLLLDKFSSYRNSHLYESVDKAINKSLISFIDTFTPQGCGESADRYYCNSHKFRKAPLGGGFNIWHKEVSSDGSGSKRAFVWMLYLNTVNNGGNTEFFINTDETIRIKPEVGKMVFWPAGETHYHRSEPFLGEDKYYISGWLKRR